MSSIKYFDKPVDIHKIRKTYSDDVEFISDISTYPLITGIAYEGKLHKAIKGKLTSKNVKEKVDKLLESYKQKLYKDWDDHFRLLFDKLEIGGITKGGPGSGRHPEGNTLMSEYHTIENPIKNIDMDAARPAVKYRGKVYIGNKGDDHLQVENRHGIGNVALERGFVDSEKTKNWLSRDDFQAITGTRLAEDLDYYQKYRKLPPRNEHGLIIDKADNEDTTKKEIIASVLAGLGIALSKDVLDFYNQAYLIGKERGVSISGQDFKDEVSAEALDKINSFDQENADYLKGFMDDLTQKYSDVIDKDYESKQAQEQELARLKKVSEPRLNLYVPAILGALAVGMTDGVREANEQNPDQEVTGMIWITQHDDNVCDGCSANDGTFFTLEEFELEYQNNECLTNCRCAESSEPTTENPENFTRSVRLSSLKKGGPGSGRHPEGKMKFNPHDYLPAMQDATGKIFIGEKGEGHYSIEDRNSQENLGDNGIVITSQQSPKSGFVHIKRPNKWINRRTMYSMFGNDSAEGLSELQRNTKREEIKG